MGMGKKPKGLCLALFLLLFLGACAETADFAPKELPEGESLQQQQRPEESQKEPQKDPQDPQEFFYYGFASLETETERQVYREVLSSLENREEKTELSTTDEGMLEQIFQRVMADHPEIFYADGYSAAAYKKNGEAVRLVFSGSYTMEEQQIASRRVLLENTVQTWLDGLDSAFGESGEGSPADDYGRVKYLYESLILHTDYETDCPDSQNICSVLLQGKSVCQGYAKTLQYLCQKTGIPAMLVTGTVDGQGHAWDLVRMDGAWYYVDPTWGDASYRRTEQEGYPQEAFPAVNYEYFCVTTGQIARTHRISPGQKLPECTAVADQYYRREGLYLEKADLNAVGEIFEKAKETQTAVVTFQCADEEVYAQLHRLLIEQQKIFDYLPAQSHTVTYADSDGQMTFTFWL